MTLKDTIEQIQGQIPSLQVSSAAEEEGTKHSLVLPLIRASGYNDSDRSEVVPEFVADARTNERVDYAIIANDNPVMVIECKAATVNLSDRRVSQLNRYYNASTAMIGILTNGIEYRFFSDFERQNVMDQDPFWEIDIENLDDGDLDLLQTLFGKGFSITSTLDSASRLKDTGTMTRVLIQQYSRPDDNFVKWLAGEAYRERITPRWTAPNLEKFKDLASRVTVQTGADMGWERMELRAW